GVLAEYKIPGLFFELRELPLGSSGKLNRAQFAEWIARGDQRVRRIG
ncbi:acyl-CoA synthetase (AMP-forming)/AMP-acid ligase II, partial [Arthrobacter russicus]|nr:acyl-CoA synthetase (AMP-forming)/AMP-acid ligase II [Arthrobacter russicus]